MFESPVWSGFLAPRALDQDQDQSFNSQFVKRPDQTSMDQSWSVFCSYKTGLNRLWFRPVQNQSRIPVFSGPGPVWSRSFSGPVTGLSNTRGNASTNQRWDKQDDFPMSKVKRWEETRSDFLNRVILMILGAVHHLQAYQAQLKPSPHPQEATTSNRWTTTPWTFLSQPWVWLQPLSSLSTSEEKVL